ncbi:hypothetical protein ACEPAH_886 [Sanghuangporus vaninii]
MEEIIEERKCLLLSDSSRNDLFSNLIRASEEEDSDYKLTSEELMGTASSIWFQSYYFQDDVATQEIHSPFFVLVMRFYLINLGPIGGS